MDVKLMMMMMNVVNDANYGQVSLVSDVIM